MGAEERLAVYIDGFNAFRNLKYYFGCRNSLRIFLGFPGNVGFADGILPCSLWLCRMWGTGEMWM